MRGRERERFAKLLSLTGSSNDGEALTALRKCNAMLKQHHLTWDDILAGRCAEQTDTDTALKLRPLKPRVSPSRTFEAAIRRERLFEQTRREERAMVMRFYVRKVPLLLRLLLFPFWVTAEMLVAMVVCEPSAFWRTMKSFAVVLVLAISSMIWLQVFEIAALVVEEAAEAGVPWAEQGWQQLDGSHDRR